MIYVQQVRSRKRPLVPLNMDNEVKIEFVNMCGVEELQFADSNDSSSTDEQMIEVITEEEEDEDEDESTMNSSGGNNSSTGQRPRKRAKLDHLSVEQKAQHRKMMNRISAQSARDRQRALMMQQEQNIGTLSASNTQLQQENKKLKLTNDRLQEECANLKSSVTDTSSLKEENTKLKSLVEELEKKLKQQEFQPKSEPMTEEDNESCCGTLEPAVLDTYPLPKGQRLQQTSAFLLLMSAFSLWISTPQKFSKLSKISQNKSSAVTQNLHLGSRQLLMKQLLHHLQQHQQKLQATPMRPPD